MDLGLRRDDGGIWLNLAPFGSEHNTFQVE
jgi:hypothetical protein